MKDFHSRKKNKKSLLTNPLFSIFLFFVLLLIINSAYKSYVKKKNIEVEHQKFLDKYESLNRRRDELKDKINSLETDNGIREEIMKVYNVGEEGETVIHITEPKI